MSDQTNECRPAGNGAASKITGGRSVVEYTVLESLAPRREYALRVVVTTAAGYARTRYYAALNPAENALKRARDRGQVGVLELVRIAPACDALGDVVHLLEDTEGVAR